MILQQFVDMLNQKGIVAVEFFKKHGTDIFSNDQILLTLLKEEWSYNKLLKLFRLEWIISTDLRRAYNKEKTYFKNMLTIYCYFEEYMNSACSFFGNKRVPFEEWEDLAKEQVELLHTLIKENKLEGFKTDPRYYAFFDKYDQKEEELFKKGYTQLRDNEYQ